MEMLPGGCFVVVAVVCQAGMQDADPSVGELVQGLVVVLAASPQLVVVAAGAGRLAEGAERPLLQGVGEPAVAGVAGQHDAAEAGCPGDG